MKTCYDYRKLSGLIREKYGTQKRFAEALGIGLSTLQSRLGNATEFTQNEMKRCEDLLDLTREETYQIFFTTK